MLRSGGKGFCSIRNETETQKPFSGLLARACAGSQGRGGEWVANLQRDDGSRFKKGGREQGVSAAFRGSDHGVLKVQRPTVTDKLLWVEIIGPPPTFGRRTWAQRGLFTASCEGLR